MSKHEPRGHFKPPIKRPYTPAERRRWREDMRRFTNACKGVMQVYLVPAEDRALVAAAAMCGEPTAAVLSETVERWMEAAMKPGARVPCFFCDAIFSPDALPAAHVISLPFADRRHVIASGVCPDCARAKDLQQDALRQLRQIWPTAYPVGDGHG